MSSSVIVTLGLCFLAIVSAVNKYLSYRNGRKAERLENAQRDIAEAKKDLDIANCPAKRGSALLDSLQRK